MPSSSAPGQITELLQGQQFMEGLATTSIHWASREGASSRVARVARRHRLDARVTVRSYSVARAPDCL